MDFDLSASSVTEALGDLQLKLQSVQEDAKLYSALEKKASSSFERHRAELTLLLQKERAIHAAAEDRLRDELQRLLSENESANEQLTSLRLQRERSCRAEVQARQKQLEEREEALQRRLLELQVQFKAARTDVDLAKQEKAWHEMQLREVLGRQRVLNEELQQLRCEAERQHARAAAEAQLQDRQSRRQGLHCGLEKAFLPSGLPDQCHTTSPSSHHIAAIVSTVERQNYYKPRLYYRRRGITSPMDRRLESPLRCGMSTSGETQPMPLLRPCLSSMAFVAREKTGVTSSSPSTPLRHVVEGNATPELSSHTGTKSGRHLAAVCRSLLREILAMRREYQDCNAALNDPLADTVELSRRMRNIMNELDRKVHQLRSLRQQQAAVEDKLKLHDMMLEIAAENNYCESIYGDLLELIRS
ncbi:hypothetical protein TraAM80_06615 [Trypanosoma rangeli]|uniref:Uncharacterized protein n=1 Tax=Trypanosoma rangeli TaxID=5698 RepID=A0A422N9G7_TRYRA|nr:uncharacterized protein TraAM80_06615 [Trypanosoma rangeli]RNF02072.1 hypothetical protein TraAM80_06615 [Trypanosoma rangeli]|eukprot:RNF02072.1 hypothetical protein TraAM80_06615 [Trypanosoma rangeli]